MGEGEDDDFFLAPARFLGNQQPSYGQQLHFKLEGGVGGGAGVLLEGAGHTLTLQLAGSGGEYSVSLQERAGWQPQLGAGQFLSLLGNLTALGLRGEPGLRGVRLESAAPGGGRKPADWVEECSCPVGYRGRQCGQCEAGWHREQEQEGSGAVEAGPALLDRRCVPCSCHGHSESCDPDTGECSCLHNTAGASCDVCMEVSWTMFSFEHGCESV